MQRVQSSNAECRTKLSGQVGGRLPCLKGQFDKVQDAALAVDVKVAQCLLRFAGRSAFQEDLAVDRNGKLRPVKWSQEDPGLNAHSSISLQGVSV